MCVLTFYFVITESPTTESGIVVNSVTEWTIRRKDLDLSSQQQDEPVCVKLRPDGTWDPMIIPCV